MQTTSIAEPQIGMLSARRQRLLLTGTLFYMIFLVGITVGMLGPSLIAFSQQTNASLRQINWLFLLMPFGFLTGIYVCRHFIEHRIVHVLVLISLFANALCVFLIAFTSSLFLLFGLLFVLAFSQGMLEIVSNVTLLKIYKKNPAPYMNVMHFCFGVGAILSPILVGWNIHLAQNIIYAYTFLAFLAFLGFGMLFFCRLEPIVPAVERARKFNHYPKRRHILITIHLFVFFYLILEAGYASWIYPFMHQTGLMNAAQAGFFVSVFWFLFTVFRLLGAFLTLRYDVLHIMLAHLILVLVGLLLVVFVGASIPILWLANIAIGAGLSVCFPSILSYCESDFRIPAKTVSHFFTAMMLGAALGPLLLGYLFTAQPFSIFYPMLFASALTVLIFFYLRKLAVQYKYESE